MREFTLQDVIDELEAGNRVLLMTRHAERPKMDNEDPSFGMTLPITENGCRMSAAFGETFRACRDDVQFLSSPLLRARMTAEHIARGMGLGGIEIACEGMLGNETPYFADAHEVFEQFRDGRFFEKIFRYFEKGRFAGFREIHEATDELEAWCLGRFTARLGVFTTHDLYACAFLYARGAVPCFTEENWTRFLDSAGIVIAPDGSKRYVLVRAGLSDGIRGV